MQTGRFITIATNYTLQHLYMFPICVKIISCMEDVYRMNDLREYGGYSKIVGGKKKIYCTGVLGNWKY